MLVVADSSPLIYLSRIRLLHLLLTLFGDVVVPRAVWDEAVERRPAAPGIESLRQASWIRVVDNPSPSPDLGLDPGETAAILVAESLHADLLLIDERPGRAVAQERGLAVRGTLGVLVQAREADLLPELRTVLEVLVAEGFRIAPALIREVPAGQRERLERVCRYVLRPPVAIERLHLTDDGRVRLSLRHPRRAGDRAGGSGRTWLFELGGPSG